MANTRPYFIPDNETLRIEKLKDYQILDTHSEDTFDKIALMAAQVFNLLDRRLLAGKAPGCHGVFALSSPGRLKIRGTADWKSAPPL